jgi:putative oxidoreductase
MLLGLEVPMAPFGATLLRLILGVVYLMHAYLGFAVFTPAGSAKFMASQGVPLPEVAAWYTIAAHGIGGIMLILGLWTRWAALANAIVMAGALVFVHLKQGFFLKGIVVDKAAGTAVAGGYEFVLLLLVATVAQILLGSGALAVTRDK